MSKIVESSKRSSDQKLSSSGEAKPPRIQLSIKHFAYYGYEVGLNKDNFFRLDHDSHPSIFVEEAEFGLTHTSIIRLGKDVQSDDNDLLYLINQLNRDSYLCKYALNRDGELDVNALYDADYSKQRYSNFLNTFVYDYMHRVVNHPKYQEYKARVKQANKAIH